MKENRKPYRTMEDIARRAGVSKSTVSRALRNHPKIPPETRRRIVAIARKAGYWCDPLTATLMGRIRSMNRPPAPSTIAYVVLENPTTDRQHTTTHPALLEGIRCRCEELGYAMDPFWPLSDRMSLERLARVLRSRGIEGVVLGPVSANSPRVRDRDLKPLANDFAVALVGYSFANLPFHRAANHNFFCTLLALDRLSALGYARPGLADHHMGDVHVAYQYSGAAAAYRAQQLAEGMGVNPLLVDPLNKRVFLRWFEAERPDAILTNEPRVRHWIEEEGLRIPRDVAYATLNVWRDPRTAGIDQNTHHVAAAAVDLVMGQLLHYEHGTPEHPKEILIRGTWVDGPTAPAKKKAKPNTHDARSWGLSKRASY